MKGIHAKGTFTRYEQALLAAATKMVAAVQEPAVTKAFPQFRHVRCHELARAVGSLLKLPVVDGIALCSNGLVEHSWLLTRRGPRSNILDVYCVDRLPMVQLVDTPTFPLMSLYQAATLQLRVPVNKGVVKMLVKMMRPKSALPANVKPDPPMYAIRRGKTSARSKVGK